MLPIDIESLDPVQRMELADVLYDSAMQVIDETALSPEQTAEIDRRLDRLSGNQATLLPWQATVGRLMQDR